MARHHLLLQVPRAPVQVGDMADILDAMAAMRAMFQEHDIKPPTAILLSSQEDGLRFLQKVAVVPQYCYVLHERQFVHMADGTKWWECNVMGIAVRWPADSSAMPDGMAKPATITKTRYLCVACGYRSPA